MTGDKPGMLYYLSFEAKMLSIDDVNNGMVAARNDSIQLIRDPKFFIFPQNSTWDFNNITRMNWVFFY